MSFSAETKNELARVISNDDYCSEKSLDYLPELGYCFTDEQGNTYKISDMVKYPF